MNNIRLLCLDRGGKLLQSRIGSTRYLFKSQIGLHQPPLRVERIHVQASRSAPHHHAALRGMCCRTVARTADVPDHNQRPRPAFGSGREQQEFPRKNAQLPSQRFRMIRDVDLYRPGFNKVLSALLVYSQLVQQLNAPLPYFLRGVLVLSPPNPVPQHIVPVHRPALAVVRTRDRIRCAAQRADCQSFVWTMTWLQPRCAASLSTTDPCSMPARRSGCLSGFPFRTHCFTRYTLKSARRGHYAERVTCRKSVDKGCKKRSVGQSPVAE